MALSSPLSIGLIGCGGMGTRHVGNIRRSVGGAWVVAVYDPDARRAERAAAASCAERVALTAQQVIEDDAVDAVIVASPDATHAAYALACLRRGKPVLCEKPLATCASDAAAIVETEVSLGRRLVSVGLMRRFDPQHVAVQQVVRSGRLGPALLYKGVHRNAAIPYQSTGEVILTNSAGHDIDAARWLLGQEVTEVYVQGVRSHASFSADTLDLFLLQMGFGNGCLATIELYAGAEYGYEVSAEVVCGRGTAMTGQPENAIVRSQGTRSAHVPGEWLERFTDAYIAEAGQWVASVQADEPFGGASAWDGYMALCVTDACAASLCAAAPVRIAPDLRPALYD